MPERFRRVDVARSVLAFVLLFAPSLLAQPDPAAAERFFQEGKRLLDARDYARACPNFAESYRLEEATGTLLALAMCHESEGKTATAWAEYRQAAERATKERRPDREKAAMEWAREVEARLSTLTLIIPGSVSNTPDLLVRLDGREVTRREWGTPVALDPGEHSVSITAAGKRPWSATIVLGRVSDRRSFTVNLDDASPEPAPSADSRKLSTTQKVGIGAAIGGVVAVGIGTFFGVRAVVRDNRSDAGCDGNACDPDAKQLRLDAREDGNRATVAFITGGVLLAGGAGLYFFGKKDSGDTRGHVRAAPMVGLREVGLAVGGAF